MSPSEIKHTRSGVETDYKEHIVDHLRELRNRLIVVIIVLSVATFFIYPFSGDIIRFLWDTLLPSGVIMSIYAPAEFLMTCLKLSVAISVGISFPVLMFELFKFMSRGLYKNEKKFLFKVVPASYILFLTGAGLAYFFILPVFMGYIIHYSDLSAMPQVSLTETINSVIVLVLGLGFVFQIPLLMVISMKMGIVQPSTLKKYRFTVYIALFSLGFFISPDPTFFAQVLVGIALVILFEISLILVKFF